MLRRRRSGGERTGTPADYLVVGLGNPGRDYESTRHNVGADVVGRLADRHEARLRRSKQDALVGEARVGGRRVALAVPTTYVNESGRAVGKLARRFGVAPEQVIVVHDELDMSVATLRVKAGGGLAGHHGLRSITQHLGTDDFLRVRIGIDKPPGGKERGADHVLRRFPKSQREEVDITIEEAADAVECIVTEGVDVAMNRFN